MDFFKKYDPDGDLSFSNISFRKGAGFGREMGIFVRPDFPPYPVYFHMGVDRKSGKIYCPFDSYVEFYRDSKITNNYGSFLIIRPLDVDFYIRVAHVENLLINVDNHVVLGGTLLALAGTAGKSDGPHTHTEIISTDERSFVCEEILRENGIEIINQLPMVLGTDDKEVRKKSIDKINALNIKAFTNAYCRRKEWPFTGKQATYYSSKILFGM